MVQPPLLSLLSTPTLLPARKSSKGSSKSRSSSKTSGRALTKNGTQHGDVVAVDANDLSEVSCRGMQHAGNFAGSSRFPCEKIVVYERDFRRFGGDIEKLRQCQVPEWVDPPKSRPYHETFEERCRVRSDVSDPWEGLLNSHRTKLTNDDSIILNQVWLNSPRQRDCGGCEYIHDGTSTRAQSRESSRTQDEQQRPNSRAKGRALGAQSKSSSRASSRTSVGALPTGRYSDAGSCSDARSQRCQSRERVGAGGRRPPMMPVPATLSDSSSTSSRIPLPPLRVSP